MITFSLSAGVVALLAFFGALSIVSDTIKAVVDLIATIKRSRQP